MSLCASPSTVLLISELSEPFSSPPPPPILSSNSSKKSLMPSHTSLFKMRVTGLASESWKEFRLWIWPWQQQGGQNGWQTGALREKKDRIREIYYVSSVVYRPQQPRDRLTLRPARPSQGASAEVPGGRGCPPNSAPWSPCAATPQRTFAWRIPQGTSKSVVSTGDFMVVISHWKHIQ